MSKKEAKITVLVVPPFGAASVETIENTLAELQAHVGGYIEPFPVGVAGALGLCNEEGILMRLPLGPVVPALGHPVCGTFVVVGDAGAEFGSLNADQIASARELFGGDDDDFDDDDFDEEDGVIAVEPIDTVFHYKGFFGCAGQCRVRIYDDGTGAVVILDERAENQGTSVVNAIDLLAVQLCDAFGLNGGRAVWIEHNPDTRSQEDRAMGVPDRFNAECFAQARFSHVERDGESWILGQPNWAPLTAEEVGVLIGEEWEPEWE